MKTMSLKVNRRHLYYSTITFLVLIILAGAWGFDYLDEKELASVSSNQPVTPPTGKISIIIKVPERTLELFSDENLHKKYRIAVGKRETPTPVGEWKVVWKDYNWGTGFGTRWMGLNVPWGIYGIHGTNNPWSIGRFASHGCIRMRNKDVEELFEWIPIGTPVRIEGQKVRIRRTLKYKSSGADVVVLQFKLKELGYLNERADGIFGLNTETSVKAFQTANGLETTGVVDQQLLPILGL